MKCPFKKTTFNLDAFGNLVGVMAGTDGSIAESREIFNECDKENCMAYFNEVCSLCQGIRRNTNE